VINTTWVSVSPLIAVLTYETGSQAENILVAFVSFGSVFVAVQAHCLLIYYIVVAELKQVVIAPITSPVLNV
jgi:hypothetical protein